MNIWKSHIRTADKEVNMKAIFAVLNTTWAVLQYRSIAVSQYRSIVVSQYRSIVVSQYRSVAVSQYCSIAVSQYWTLLLFLITFWRHLWSKDVCYTKEMAKMTMWPIFPAIFNVCRLPSAVFNVKGGGFILMKSARKSILFYASVKYFSNRELWGKASSLLLCGKTTVSHWL